MGLSGPAGKKWRIPLLVILFIILAVETAVLVVIVIVFESSAGSQIFPGFAMRNVQPGCRTLTSTVLSTSATNRTVLFNCPGSGNAKPALIVRDSNNFGFFPINDVFGAVPTFTLPKGYQSLSLDANGNCLSQGGDGIFWIPLKSGVEVAVGGQNPYTHQSFYDYCAVLDNSTSNVESFMIHWSPGTPPRVRPAPFTVTVSPTSETVPRGGRANFTVTVTSLGGWIGVATVDLAGGYTLGIPYQVSSPTLSLKAGGSNMTTLSTPTCNADRTYCAPLGRNTIVVEAYTGCLMELQYVCLDQYASAGMKVVVNIT